MGCENTDPKLEFGHEGRYFSIIDGFRKFVEAQAYEESVFSYPERNI